MIRNAGVLKDNKIHNNNISPASRRRARRIHHRNVLARRRCRSRAPPETIRNNDDIVESLDDDAREGVVVVVVRFLVVPLFGRAHMRLLPSFLVVVAVRHTPRRRARGHRDLHPRGIPVRRREHAFRQYDVDVRHRLRPGGRHVDRRVHVLHGEFGPGLAPAEDVRVGTARLLRREHARGGMGASALRGRGHAEHDEIQDAVDGDGGERRVRELLHGADREGGPEGVRGGRGCRPPGTLVSTIVYPLSL